MASSAAVITRWRFWVGIAAGLLLLLWLLNDILLPFVVGGAVAYLCDPLVVRLQRVGLSRTWATTAVTVFAALVCVGAAAAVLPPLLGQVEELIANAPKLAVKAVQGVQPMIEPIRQRMGLPPLGLHDLQTVVTERAGQVLGMVGGVAGGLARRGFAVINLLSLLFLTPVVTFYLLRDWPKVLASIDRALPRDHAATIRRLAHESNGAVAGYARGQALVCLCLGSFYAVGLTIVGLQFGMVIGLIAGVISFIPFVGTLVGAVLSIGMALAQFPPDWMSVVWVAVVFVVGNVIEGNFLSPKLVGDRVGLHPVWIMFALLAGGSLFGFTGVLLAVPVAAVIGVVVRHLMKRYRDSTLYRGGLIS